MAKYVVMIGMVGLPGETVTALQGNRLVEVVQPRYFRRGAVVDLDPKVAAPRVAKGYLKEQGEAEKDVEAKAKADEEAAATQAEELKARQEPVDGEERLTEKQQARRDAGDRGLSTEGTTAQLHARIKEYDEAAAEDTGNEPEKTE